MNIKHLFISGLSAILFSCSSLTSRDESLLHFVDTRIGTGKTELGIGTGDNQNGQTIPAVFVPNGMNFWTAQTEATEKKGIAPYYFGHHTFQGFRNSHWIDGGCTQDYGSVTVMPVWGTLKCLEEERESTFSHEDEIALPHYYSVLLKDYPIQAEVTGTSRTGIFRFTYRQEGTAHLIITPNSDENVAEIQVNADKKEITGKNPVHRIYQGKGEYAGFDGHFVVQINKEIEDFGIYHGHEISKHQSEAQNLQRLGAFVSFHVKAGEEVLVKVASSFCDIEGAKMNMAEENPGWNFDTVKSDLAKIWEERLGVIEVKTNDEIDKQKFYSSMYHASFLPHEMNDCDGRYPSFAGGKSIEVTKGAYYDDYSMWDTYRALHPLLSILYPQQTGDMIQSLVQKYEQGGWLPIFPCWNSYTSEMIGDHCASLMTDAYIKGIRNFDVDKAYQAARKNAFEIPDSYDDYKDGKGRRALDSYLKYGYIPLEDPVMEAYHKGEQVSRTMEYAYDDFVLSEFAKALGHEEDAKVLRQRSLSYKNVIDPRTGYAQGRHIDGSFLDENNAFQFCKFITEGYPSHYTWYVPHDVYGLMECMGGKEKYVAKLDSMFTNEYYWHGNEPCHQVAFMFNYAGQPWKTQKAVRHIMETEYNIGSDGLSGNDDAGQMSAWYIFAALGFYPVCPGTPYYMLASPSFKEATIHMSSGKSFILKAPKASHENIYVQSVTLNGHPYTKNYIAHQDIAAGGIMEFEMGNKPNESWGSKDEDCPINFFRK